MSHTISIDGVTVAMVSRSEVRADAVARWGEKKVAANEADVARRFKRCANCRRKATYEIHSAFESSANGKLACDQNVCWGLLTGGYPAQGRRIAGAK